MAKSFLRRLKEKLVVTVGPSIGAVLLRILYATLRVRTIDRERLEVYKREGGRYLMAFWHGNLLLMVFAYVGSRLTFLVSWHRDGELVTRVMKYFGINPTRGSTTRGGMKALRMLLKKAKQGYDIAFTPDGPRGPLREAQVGVVQTARLSGLPIVPFAVAARKKKRLLPGMSS